MIIDFHTHIVPPRIKENPGKYVERDPGFANLYSSPNPRLATADDLIASMDKDGVDISVALNISWATHELCAETNDYIMEAIARYPKRLIGFGTVQLQSLDAALDEIERCAKGGIKGIGEMRFDRQLLGAARDNDILKSFIKAITKHNLSLLIHASEPVGHQYPGKGDTTPDVLYTLITSFPDLTLVCAHWGGGLPFYALMPEVRKAMSKVFFDTAASPYLYSPQIYNQAIQLAGADKILFGSDCPLLPPSRLLKEIRALDLPPEIERLVLSDNAQRLLGIGSKPGEI